MRLPWRVELLEGQIIEMAAKGTAHSAAVTRIERLLRNRLGDRGAAAVSRPGAAE